MKDYENYIVTTMERISLKRTLSVQKFLFPSRKELSVLDHVRFIAIPLYLQTIVLLM